jgi:predicted  nucleic acid-binding Zn-ribbon protein
MKSHIIIGVGFLVVMGVVALSQFGSSTEVIQERTASSSVPLIEEDVLDIIESARKELERINTELDAEETRLLEERKKLDARLEQIRETRSGF